MPEYASRNDRWPKSSVAFRSSRDNVELPFGGIVHRVAARDGAETKELAMNIRSIVGIILLAVLIYLVVVYF